jgi:hypothetical protein
MICSFQRPLGAPLEVHSKTPSGAGAVFVVSDQPRSQQNGFGVESEAAIALRDVTSLPAVSIDKHELAVRLERVCSRA